MSTLAQMNAIRDANLGDTAPDSPSTPLRDPICDRNVFDAVVGQLYAAPINDTGLSPTNTITTKQTISGVTFSYSFEFKKVGNLVTVLGRIAVTTGTTINNQVIAIITNSEYLPKTGSNVPVFLQKENSTGQVLQFLIFNSSGNIRANHVSGTLDAGIGYIANFSYYTNP